MKLKLRTGASTVAMDTTNLAPSLIWSRCVACVFVIVPAVVPIVVVGTTVGSAMTTTVVVVTATRSCNICRNRNRGDCLRLRRQLEFMLNKLLMDLCDGRVRVSASDLIHNHLVILSESLDNELNLVFMIKRLLEQRQLIKAGRKSLHILIDRLSALSPLFELLTQLQYMTAAWLSICSGESVSDICCSGGGSEKRLDMRCHGSKQCTIDKLILVLPKRVLSIDGDLIINHGCW